MAIPQQNGGNFARGGNQIFHALSMYISNIVRLGFLAGIVWLVGTLWASYQFAGNDYEILWIHLQAWFWSSTFQLNHPVEWHLWGRSGTASASAMLTWSGQYLPAALSHIKQVSYLVFLAVGIGTIFLALLFKRRGVDLSRDIFQRGQRLVSESHLAKLTAKHRSGLSKFRIGDVAIPNNLLMRNVAFVGSMGTGKSQGIMPMIEIAGKDKLKSVIYDPTGEFLEFFYRPGDLILNPLDQRCSPWDLFADLQESHDARTLANYLVPEDLGGGDGGKMWLDAARGLLADLLKIESTKAEPSLAGVGKMILLPLSELVDLLAEHKSPSGATMNAKNPRGSESIRLTLASSEAVRLFHLFPYRPGGLSLRKQTREDGSRRIFITSSPSRASLIQPWAAAWLELLTLGSMEIRPVNHLRTIFFLDELASLPRLKSLETSLTMARKYGVMTVVGIQGIAQLEAIYGPERTRILVGNLQTKAVFRVEDDQSSQRLSEILGKREVQEVTENANVSLSEQESHGNTLGHQRKEISAVMPSEIQTLPDLTCFLKIAGDYPVAKVEYPYKKRRSICPDFITVCLPAIPATEQITTNANTDHKNDSVELVATSTVSDPKEPVDTKKHDTGFAKTLDVDPDQENSNPQSESEDDLW